MAEEIITPTNNTSEPQTDDNKQQTADPKAPEEKVIPKKLFDEKVSELTKKYKALEQQLKAKMTDEEKQAAENAEKDAEFQTLKNELAALKTESAFTAAGIKSEIAKSLSAAIVGADVSAIVEAVKSAVADIEKETTARVKRELLENGSPEVPVGNSSTEKPDPNIERIKRIVKKPDVKPLSESKWVK